MAGHESRARWRTVTKPGLGVCAVIRRLFSSANNWKPIRKPVHGPHPFPVSGGAGRSSIVEAK
jgi:hypothetical protein